MLHIIVITQFQGAAEDRVIITMISQSEHDIPYTQNNWRVKYLAN